MAMGSKHLKAIPDVVCHPHNVQLSHKVYAINRAE